MLISTILSHCAKIVFFLFLLNFGDVKNEVFERKIAFFCLFNVGKIETEKRKTDKMEKPKPYKNRFFKVVIQKCGKSKSGFLAKIA